MTVSFADGWDASSLKYLEPLAANVYECFSEIVGSELAEHISLLNDPDAECPLAYFDKNDSGEFQIRLTLENQGLWCKFIYQFAHELCHLYSNHSCSHGHKHKWLEESFCEAASITILEKIAANWGNSKMFEYNAEYEASVWEYRESIVSKIKLYGTEQEFTDWLCKNVCHLEASSTQRDLNSIVAYNLIKHCLDKNLRNWRVIKSLNKWNCHADDTYEKFLQNFRKHAEKEKSDVTAVFRILNCQV